MLATAGRKIPKSWRQDEKSNSSLAQYIKSIVSDGAFLACRRCVCECVNVCACITNSL
jgi:hypothetical protein